jgi:WD40 repeat protein
MQVLEVGQTVFLLRFLPDGRRLVVGTVGPYPDQMVTFHILSLATGERIPLNMPRAKINDWWNQASRGNAIAVHPSGESCYIAWGARLFAFRTADGESLPVPQDVEANQVVLSPDGERLLAFHLQPEGGGPLVAITTGPRGGAVVGRTRLPAGCRTVAGFLPDGERFVSIDKVVRIRSAATGEELAAGKYKVFATHQPQVSADGRYLAALGYGNMYVWDLTTLTKPGKIGGTATFGDFRSCALHPNGKTVAVIHGGPTLVKVYDLATLKQVHKWTWKLGPLRSVAYSPDGTVGAAGSDDGRIVVWDADERAARRAVPGQTYGVSRPLAPAGLPRSRPHAIRRSDRGSD